MIKELFKKIANFFNKDREVWELTNQRIEQAQNYKEVHRRICQLKGCKSKLKGLNRYKCPYCKKVFCEKHRLPENHKCKNPEKPFELKKGQGWMYSTK